MKTAERIVIVSILVLLLGGGYAGYAAVQQTRADYRAEIATGAFEIRDEQVLTTDESIDTDADWRQIYPNTIPVLLAGVAVQASIADTMTTRIAGLSNTPYLPDDVIKLFAFGVPGPHSIWMKDMNYAIDIIWVEESGSIVHIEENVSPDTFPNSFASPTPAWYVVEANAGFVARNEVKLGDTLIVP